jgi:hypothetical protein
MALEFSSVEYNVKPLVVFIALLVSNLACQAQDNKIRYKDIEGTWILAGDAPSNPSEDCAAVNDGVALVIDGKSIRGQEFDCTIQRGRFHDRSTIILRADCGAEGDEVIRKYAFSLRAGLLQEDLKEYRRNDPRKKESYSRNTYRRAVCSNSVDVNNKTNWVGNRLTGKCSWMEAAFRSRYLPNGNTVEVQFYGIDSTGPVTIRSFSANNRIQWTHEAQYSCQLGIPLCWLSLTDSSARKQTSDSKEGQAFEIISVNPDQVDQDEEKAIILVIAGIPMGFKNEPHDRTLDIKFSPTYDLSQETILYVPEVYYFHRCN